MGGGLLRGQELAERLEQGPGVTTGWLGIRLWGLGITVSLQKFSHYRPLGCCLPRPSTPGAIDLISHQRRAGVVPGVSVYHLGISDFWSRSVWMGGYPEGIRVEMALVWGGLVPGEQASERTGDDIWNPGWGRYRFKRTWWSSQRQMWAHGDRSQ